MQSVLVVAVRPAALLEQEGMQPIADLFNQHMEIEQLLGWSVEDID